MLSKNPIPNFKVNRVFYLLKFNTFYLHISILIHTFVVLVENIPKAINQKLMRRRLQPTLYFFYNAYLKIIHFLFAYVNII